MEVLLPSSGLKTGKVREANVKGDKRKEIQAVTLPYLEVGLFLKPKEEVNISWPLCHSLLSSSR
jgi:hypothetical protein